MGKIDALAVKEKEMAAEIEVVNKTKSKEKKSTFT